MAQVEIYTRPFCSYCYRAKGLLDAKGIAYDEREIGYGGAERAEMIQRSNGRTTVPQLFIDGRHIGGCDVLMALARSGKLDALLTA